MSVGSYNSDDYRYIEEIDQESLNHPSIDKYLDSSFSSQHSYEQPSQIQSEIIDRTKSNYVKDNIKIKSNLSEPVLVRSQIVSLTEEELARHNTDVPPISAFSFQPQIENEQVLEEEYGFPIDERAFFKKLDEHFNLLKQDFEDKIKRLEEQCNKAEEEFNQSKSDIKELKNIEKEYINQGIQTDVSNEDMERIIKIKNDLPEIFSNSEEFKSNLTKWKIDSKKLKESEHFVETTKRIIWEKPFIPLDRICRQLPTAVNLDDIEDDEDICDFHREKYSKVMRKAIHDKELYQNHPNATLTRLSKIIQQ